MLGGLAFQATEFIPNVAEEAERPVFEVEARLLSSLQTNPRES